MAIARTHQIALDTTRYYHCISRCVRRAFLCGDDPLTGKNLDYRKEWILHRLQELSQAFAVQICAYAIMSNHYHLVLYVDLEQARSWSDEEVARRWKSLLMTKKPSVEEKKETKQDLSNKELQQISIWRERLTDLSWFMRYLNEKIARKANQEDQCTGRFWEGRFKSQALIDEGALLACMAYVDLNPIRAKVCQTPEESDFASIQERIRSAQIETPSKATKLIETSEASKKSLPPLAPFQEEKSIGISARLPISKTDYLALVDWTGRTMHASKKGMIPESLAPILVRLGLQEEGWVKMTTQFSKSFSRAVGQVGKLKELGKQWGQSWLQGMKSARECYLSPAI